MTHLLHMYCIIQFEIFEMKNSALVLILFILHYALALPTDGAEQGRAPCGPMDWFRYNVRHTIYKPWLDSLSIVLYANGKNFEHKTVIRDLSTCELAGITNGLDVLQVLYKIYIDLLLPNSFYTVPDMAVFDICTEQMNKHDFNKQQVLKHNREAAFHARDCEAATRIFHCAAFHVSWTVPWLFGIGAFLLFLCMLPLIAACAWLCKN